MATWLEMSRSPEYSPAILSRELRKVHYLVGIDEFDEALAGETIILGGYLNTKLIKAKSIFAEHLDVDSLSAISANIGEVTSGTLTGATIRTSVGSDRIELSNNLLRSYSSGIRRVQLDYDSLDFYDEQGRLGGEVVGAIDPIWGTPELLLRANTGAVKVESYKSSTNYAHVITRTVQSPEEDGTNYILLEVQEGSGYSNYGGFQVGPGGAVNEGFLYVTGDFGVDGDKAAIVKTENYGTRKLYALEAPESRFITYMERELEVGEHYIEIEPMFRETISDYFVLPHVQNNADVSILERLKNGFRVLVEGKKSEVVFEVNGTRRGYEGVYMEEVQHDLKGMASRNEN